MKTLFVLAFAATLLELGSARKCYECNGESCDASLLQTRVCSSNEDGCLSVTDEGSFRHKRCLKYDDCTLMKVRQMFPAISNMKFSCCTSDLCNAASLSVASHSLVGLLISVVLFFWRVM